MDRLICGEVGFGKTEVAMRAAFVSAMNSKQICILVPTTLLASQHFASFEERFKDTGINVSLLSRNVSSKDKELLLNDLENGDIDIIIGTHALIQGHINFKDLGLLIIDEEHRFGVRQKEKIKSLKDEVEVLSLSATPIPRSLNFALSELKDLSIIATAPDDRLPVKTFTYSFNENLIHEAIQRENLRGGQTYYLCNDLSLIEDRKQRLKDKFNDLTIEIVHGQLKPKVIEEIMVQFNSGI
jgi:transcription-repair coupling factor (superfamily II helicase)